MHKLPTQTKPGVKAFMLPTCNASRADNLEMMRTLVEGGSLVATVRDTYSMADAHAALQASSEGGARWRREVGR